MRVRTPALKRGCGLPTWPPEIAALRKEINNDYDSASAFVHYSGRVCSWRGGWVLGHLRIPESLRSQASARRGSQHAAVGSNRQRRLASGSVPCECLVQYLRCSALSAAEGSVDGAMMPVALRGLSRKEQLVIQRFG